MDDGAYRPARAHRQRRLNVKVSLRHLVAGPRRILLRGLPDRPHEIALVAAQAQLGTNAKQCRQRNPP